MQAPPNQGSNWFNYKGTHSIVLLAMCDAFYRFIYVSVGESGRRSDGGVFENSGLSAMLECNDLNIPPDSKLPGSEKIMPYTVAADDAFPLRRNIIKPFPGKKLTVPKVICNYRISRARRCIENAFGILCSRWRIFYSPINVGRVKHIKFITKACCALHNFLMSENNNPNDPDNYTYCPTDYIDTIDRRTGVLREGGWRREWRTERGDRGDALGMFDIEPIVGGSAPVDGKLCRDNWMDYFNNEGAVDWQVAHCTATGRVNQD
jgi:hypothetical protein